LVLRAAFDPQPLAREVDRALADAHRDSRLSTGGVGSSFQYVPMMCERTPVSVALLDDLAGLATQLLGRAVLPVRAKGTRYVGETSWHRDRELDVPSVGLAAYLSPLDADDGALRVLPGSHRASSATAPTGTPPDGLAMGVPLATEPGDIIAFDEGLWHASTGGAERRQWRVDFVADPSTPAEEDQVRRYFEGVFQVGWDGGYDVDRYPSYGAAWCEPRRAWVDRLRALGAIDRAHQEEAAVRSKGRS
jgi:hypothetical protein